MNETLTEKVVKNVEEARKVWMDGYIAGVEDSINVISIDSIVHGDQYGTWLATSEDADQLAKVLRHLLPLERDEG